MCTCCTCCICCHCCDTPGALGAFVTQLLHLFCCTCCTRRTCCISHCMGLYSAHLQPVTPIPLPLAVKTVKLTHASNLQALIYYAISMYSQRWIPMYSYLSRVYSIRTMKPLIRPHSKEGEFVFVFVLVEYVEMKNLD